MKIKRCLSMLLAVLVLLCTIALPASAEGYTNDIEPHCKSLFLVNLDTDAVVYAYNPDEQMPMASITKIMTFIVAYENISDPENTVINTGDNFYYALQGTDSSMAGLYTDENLTALQLYNMMLIPSGNDAAYVLAEYVGGDGGIDQFINMMNDKARELGCNNTHFNDVSGLSSDNHYSTARDLATIAQYALTLPYFAEITNLTYYTLPATNRSESRTVYTTNAMLNQNMDDGAYYYEYTRGIKTGTTDEAGYCVVTSAVKGGYSYLCVALGNPSVDSEGNPISVRGDMLDSKALYEWAFDNFELKTVLSAGEILADVDLDYVWGKDSLQLMASASCTALLPSEVEPSSIMMSFDLPDQVDAPIAKGTKIGTVTLRYADTDIRTVDLVAAESVERSDIAAVLTTGQELLTSPWFKIVTVVLIFFVILYVIMLVVYNVKRKRITGDKRR